MAMRLAILILRVVGVSEPVGALSSWPRLRAVGRLTSASNAPLVFNQVGGIEFWASRYRFTFRDRAGRVEGLRVTNDVLSRIRGPHTRTAASVVPIGLGAIAGPELFLERLQYGLCRGGPLARELGYAGDLAQATIEIESGSPFWDPFYTADGSGPMAEYGGTNTAYEAATGRIAQATGANAKDYTLRVNGQARARPHR